MALKNQNKNLDWMKQKIGRDRLEYSSKIKVKFNGEKHN
jgi:hypothetical protein